MRTILIKKDQTLMDIALQEYGSLESMDELVRLNGLRGYTDNIYQGDELVVGDPLQVRVVSFLADYALQTARDVRPQGIGYWAVGRDFEVS